MLSAPHTNRPWHGCHLHCIVGSGHRQGLQPAADVVCSLRRCLADAFRRLLRLHTSSLTGTRNLRELVVERRDLDSGRVMTQQPLHRHDHRDLDTPHAPAGPPRRRRIETLTPSTPGDARAASACSRSVLSRCANATRMASRFCSCSTPACAASVSPQMSAAQPRPPPRLVPNSRRTHVSHTRTYTRTHTHARTRTHAHTHTHNKRDAHHGKLLLRVAASAGGRSLSGGVGADDLHR
jgi:hypothetical protein